MQKPKLERKCFMTHLEKLQKDFINLRTGTLIHFNSATIQFCQGNIEDWEFGHENNGEPRLHPFDEKAWNPVNIDCRAWADTAKAGGSRFAAYTAKHHEGFCTWPTEYTEHCVRNATNKTDVVKEYLTAFREAGIVAGLYFSILDITAGINRKGITEEQKTMIKGELTELLSNYGEIPFIMFDGWNSPWGGPSYEMLPFEEINNLIKSLQPDCLAMVIGWNEDIKHSDICFYEGGAGQQIADGFNGPGIFCQKLTDTWFWRTGHPTAPLHSIDTVMEMIEDCFAHNVNFCNNISPNRDGGIDENLMQGLTDVGKRIVYPPSLGEGLPDGWMTC